jgi:hypothetical protein
MSTLKELEQQRKSLQRKIKVGINRASKNAKESVEEKEIVKTVKPKKTHGIFNLESAILSATKPARA